MRQSFASKGGRERSSRDSRFVVQLVASPPPYLKFTFCLKLQNKISARNSLKSFLKEGKEGGKKAIGLTDICKR